MIDVFDTLNWTHSYSSNYDPMICIISTGWFLFQNKGMIWNDERFSEYIFKQLSFCKGVILAEQNVAPALRDQGNISAY